MRKALFSFLVLASVWAGWAEAGPWGNRVYLATYPRSGNHWMRYLIEEATHIATSSVYPDPEPKHLPDPFPWGAYCAPFGYEGECRYPEPGEPVVVKTHYPALDEKPGDFRVSAQTIRVVRHPVDSIYSWYVYKCKRQGQVVQDRIPNHLLVKMIAQWKKFQKYWDQSPNVLTFRYEDLLKQPKKHLKMTLDACGYAYTQEDVNRAISKHPPEGHELKHVAHYTHADLKLIKKELSGLMRKYGYTTP